MTLLYFAYGSNLHVTRLKQRVPSARVVDTAILPGYRLTFDKHGIDDSGKCNIIADDAKAEVHGVVYELSKVEQPLLDRFEAGYDFHPIKVNTQKGNLSSYTYIAHDDKTNQTLLPYHWYKLYVLHGAMSHGLDSDYCSLIASQTSIQDPNTQRNDHHYSILGIETDQHQR